MRHDGGGSLDEEYVEARRVLLDALYGLGPQRGAFVLVGAQAIYLRAGPGSLPVAEFTTDGDLALDPGLLADSPGLGELMEGAGFEPARAGASAEPGIWEASAIVNGVATTIPVDLIVPAGIAAPGGRRGARLGPHGKRVARKTRGLEAALVDNDVMEIGALDAADNRKVAVRVAGIAALFVAKAHKIDDRLESDRRDRLDDKDAADVIRLMQAGSAAEVGKTLAELCDHPVAGGPAEHAVRQIGALFGNRAGAGIEMASRALRLAMPEERVRTICLAYVGDLLDSIESA